ncbi:hypothetical protein OEZ86_011913 [Tetradesmus obliquus]|nr:hypothetical protein OEZ86_011913 [Tetradesmus obliquus]
MAPASCSFPSITVWKNLNKLLGVHHVPPELVQEIGLARKGVVAEKHGKDHDGDKAAAKRLRRKRRAEAAGKKGADSGAGGAAGGSRQQRQKRQPPKRKKQESEESEEEADSGSSSNSSRDEDEAAGNIDDMDDDAAAAAAAATNGRSRRAGAAIYDEKLVVLSDTASLLSGPLTPGLQQLANQFPAMKVATALLMALVVSSAVLSAASMHTPQQAKSARPTSSLARTIHRNLLAAKAAAAEAAQSSGQIYRGWWHDVPLPAVNGQYNGWWHDVPNANPTGQYNGWGQDFLTPFVAGGK